LKETEELKKAVVALRELGEDWRENATVLNDSFRSDRTMVEPVRRLLKENNQGSLIKIGLACLAFPEPVVSDLLGYGLLAAGLIQRKIKNSALYLEDIERTFPRLLRELRETKREIV
jgi:hypothetical protein